MPQQMALRQMADSKDYRNQVIGGSANKVQLGDIIHNHYASYGPGERRKEDLDIGNTGLEHEWSQSPQSSREDPKSAVLLRRE